MNKAREKAEELVDKFRGLFFMGYPGEITEKSKEAAIISIDFGLSQIIWSSDFNGEKRKELEKIKEEIKKIK